MVFGLWFLVFGFSQSGILALLRFGIWRIGVLACWRIGFWNVCLRHAFFRAFNIHSFATPRHFDPAEGGLEMTGTTT